MLLPQPAFRQTVNIPAVEGSRSKMPANAHFPADPPVAPGKHRRVAVKIIDDCDHFYSGHEDLVSAIVADWLDEIVVEPRRRDVEKV